MESSTYSNNPNPNPKNLLERDETRPRRLHRNSRWPIASEGLTQDHHVLLRGQYDRPRQEPGSVL
jgi:hypothetical protein